MSYVVAARVSETERALLRAAASVEGVPVATLLRRIVLPAVAERVTRTAQEVVNAERDAVAA